MPNLAQTANGNDKSIWIVPSCGMDELAGLCLCGIGDAARKYETDICLFLEIDFFIVLIHVLADVSGFIVIHFASQDHHCICLH